MFDRVISNKRTPSPHEVAAAFRQLGWIGLWLQTVLAVVPVGLVSFGVFFTNPARAGSVRPSSVLSFIAVLALLFTIYWCFHYTRIAIQLEDPDSRPPRSSVAHDVWIGLTANVSVMLFAILVGVGTVGRLLFLIMSQPTGSATTLQRTPAGTVINPGALVTAMDLIGLQATFSAITAGLTGMIISLWLLRSLR